MILVTNLVCVRLVNCIIISSIIFPSLKINLKAEISINWFKCIFHRLLDYIESY